jgi:GxxExxY protein
MNVASIGGSQSSHDRHVCRSAESAHIYGVNANSLVLCRGAVVAAHRGMTETTTPQLAHGELTGRILGCFYATYADLGHGFSEEVLRRALTITLQEAGMRVARSVPLQVHFRGHMIGSFFADLIVDRTVLIEVKATARIENYAIAQTLNYLKVAGGGVGLLLNFGRKPESKRLVIGDPFNSLPALRAESQSSTTDQLATEEGIGRPSAKPE